MRNLVIATLCLGILVGAWGFYDDYSDHKLAGYSNQIQESVIRDIEDGKWDVAYKTFCDMSDDWHQYKKSANFFLDCKSLNDADYSFARAKYYIKAKDESNAPGELACLKEQLTFLHNNESFSPGNIF